MFHWCSGIFGDVVSGETLHPYVCLQMAVHDIRMLVKDRVAFGGGVQLLGTVWTLIRQREQEQEQEQEKTSIVTKF